MSGEISVVLITRKTQSEIGKSYFLSHLLLNHSPFSLTTLESFFSLLSPHLSHELFFFNKSSSANVWNFRELQQKTSLWSVLTFYVKTGHRIKSYYFSLKPNLSGWLKHCVLPGKGPGPYARILCNSLLHPLISCSYLIVSLENCILFLVWTDPASAFSHKNPLNLPDKEPSNCQIPLPSLSTYRLIR